jgi:small-conductance mechanosensitive channel
LPIGRKAISNFQSYIQNHTTELSPELVSILIKSGYIIAIAMMVSYVLRKSLRSIKRYNDKKDIDNTKLIFIRNSLNFLIYTIAFVIISRTIPQLRDVGTSLLAGAGILAAIIGFASQAAFSNIISGVFIVLFKPFRVDDIIEFKDGLKGTVTEITFRHTVIKDFENKRIIIPNTIISNDTIINSSIDDEMILKHIHFGIAYNADVDLAIKIIREEIEKHPLCMEKPMKMNESSAANENKVAVFMTSWESSAIQLRANVWTRNSAEAFELRSNVLYSIKKRFDKEGIEIPYPYQNVVIKK